MITDADRQSPADLRRTLPDGRQRVPGPAQVGASLVQVLPRVPGMLLAAVRYGRARPGVHHEFRDGVGEPDGPDPDRPWPGDPGTVLRRRHGRGALYRRVYRVRVEDARTGPEELIAKLVVDPNRASPTEVSVFEPVPGDGRGPGAEMAVRMPGPWDAPVRIVERTPTSFRLATLRGHMEAGEIEFSARWDGGTLVFTIESWARSGDRLYDLVYHRLPLLREMQLHMWTHVCQEVVRLVGGRSPGGVQVLTERWR